MGDPEINARIEAYEMAYRMQARAPELIDFDKESQETLDLYGVKKGRSNFASNCLLARRLAERGTRFIQLYHSGWDAHSDVEGNVKNQAKAVDQASAALVQDLKRLGMLEDTLVVWGGEFGQMILMLAVSQPDPDFYKTFSGIFLVLSILLIFATMIFGKEINGKIVNDANDFAMTILEEANVATVSGDSFGNKNCLRISYAASKEEIIEAVSRIKNLLADN